MVRSWYAVIGALHEPEVQESSIDVDVGVQQKSSGLCPVVCKRDVVSGVCCVARLVGTKRVKCIANTQRQYFKRRQARRLMILNETINNYYYYYYSCRVLF